MAKENNHNGLSNKELIIRVLNKIEKIDERLERGSGKIADNRTEIETVSTRVKLNQKVLFGGLGFIIGCLGSLLILILKLHKIW